MGDSVKSSILAVLPDLSSSILDILLEALQNVGVETSEDLQFVTEKDLDSFLRPIQARKLLAAWKQATPNQEPLSQVSFLSSSPSVQTSSASSSSTSFSPLPSPSRPLPSLDWVGDFKIPFENFPEALMQSLQRQQRPSPKLRRQMVRIIVEHMMKFCPSPSIKDSTEIAKKLVAMHPKSLQDVIGGDVVGVGYHSLVKQIQARVENVKRSSSPMIQKRRRSFDAASDDTVELSPERRACVQDTYGCIRFDVKYLPVTETEESQQEKKNLMKDLCERMNFSSEEVTSLMKCTYVSQRKAINKGENIKTLLEEWPFLFQEVGMNTHFEELTGIPLKETFLITLEKKAKRLLHFLKTTGLEKNRRVREVFAKLCKQRGQLEGFCEDVKDMMLLLLSYFDEKETVLFQCVDETCLAKEVPTESLPATPCVIICGSSCYASRIFMLSIDQEVVNDHITDFLSAICLMFGSYYCLNIHYPQELASTLEFLQRCLFNINPEKGTKVEKSKKKTQLVNPRVLTLIADLSDHEWRETV